MSNLNTFSLIENLKKLNGDLLKIVKAFKNIKEILGKKEKRLTIPTQLSYKIDELHTLLITVDDKLEDIQDMVDPSDAVAYKVKKERQKVNSRIKRSIEKPGKEINYLEQKIRLRWENIEKFGKADIDKIVKDFLAIQSFIKKELQLLNTAYKANNHLPNSRYKKCLLEQLNNSCRVLDKNLITPNEISSKIKRSLAAMDSTIAEIDKLCKNIAWAINGVIAAINELTRMEKVLEELNEALEDKMVIDTSEHPVLTPVKLRIDRVSGLEEGVKNLELLFGKLKDLDKVKNNITTFISDFKTVNDLQRKFEKS